MSESERYSLELNERKTIELEREAFMSESLLYNERNLTRVNPRVLTSVDINSERAIASELQLLLHKLLTLTCSNLTKRTCVSNVS